MCISAWLLFCLSEYVYLSICLGCLSGFMQVSILYVYDLTAYVRLTVMVHKRKRWVAAENARSV